MQPLISIVSVVRNDPEGLERTIASVTAQSFQSREYIVVDGGSTDGTSEVLQSRKQNIDKIISESDSGLYDAMNKGVGLAHGEWIIFLNAGDTFYSSETLVEVASGLQQKADAAIVIGRVEHAYADGFRQIPPQKTIDLRWGMRFCHQATFIRAEYQRENPFLMADGLAADYGFFLRALTQDVGIKRIDTIVASFEVSGLSSVSHIDNIQRERRLYVKYMKVGSHIFWLRSLYALAAAGAKGMLPLPLVNWVRALK